MGATNQQRPEVLRLYSIDPAANGVYTVNTPATGWIVYPEGLLQPAGTGVILNRTGTGVYLITLPRNYTRQQVQIFCNVMDSFGTWTIALGNSLGGALPVFNTITISTFSDAGVTAANKNFTLEISRARIVPTAG